VGRQGRRAHGLGGEEDFEVEVDGGGGVGGEVGEWGGVAGGTGCEGDAVGGAGFHGDDPGGDGGGEAFAEEWAEGLVLPGLDVAGGPVVEEGDAEEVLLGFGDGNGMAEVIASGDVGGYFELVVELLGWAEGVEFDLAVGAGDGSSAEDDGGGSPVVSDGDVFVVGEQGLVGTEEFAYVGGVVEGGVEVGVVGDIDGLGEADIFDGAEVGFDFGDVYGGGGFGEELGQSFAECGWATLFHEGVEIGCAAGCAGFFGEQGGVGECVEVEDGVADADGEVGACFGLEGTVGEVLEWEVAVWGVGGGEPALWGGVWHSRKHTAGREVAGGRQQRLDLWLEGSSGVGGAGLAAGPSTAPFAKCANDFAQDDEFVAGEGEQATATTNTGISPLRCASVEMTEFWVGLRRAVERSSIPHPLQKRKG